MHGASVRSYRRFAVYCWGVLAYLLGIILWGAYVRASGSGAGCGRHWPTCGGTIIPRDPQVETLIEYAHRITSGFGMVLVIILVIVARRLYPKAHLVRWAAYLTLFFMVTEALVGAGLVLFELVADDESPARAVVIGVHLVNTFLLVGAVTLAAWWTSGKDVARSCPARKELLLCVLAWGGVLLVGASGAITALGDTLFPAESLRQSIVQDFSPTAHVLVQLRIIHPMLALIVAGYLVMFALSVGYSSESAVQRRVSNLLILVVAAQICLGFANVALLAPTWLQLVHLLVADVVWILLVIFSAIVFERREGITARYQTAGT